MSVDLNYKRALTILQTIVILAHLRIVHRVVGEFYCCNASVRYSI